MSDRHQLPFKPTPGLALPGTNFQRVRDGRNAPAFYYDVDLTSARSIAAGTHLVLPIAGNVFFADPTYDLSGSSISGIARVHFQDTNLGAPGTPVTVFPSTLLRVPFTQLLVENYAQSGKNLRIIYGVDLDIQPGASQQVLATVLNSSFTVGGTLGNLLQQLIAGKNVLTAQDFGADYGTSFSSTATLTAGTPQNVLAAASNVNGARVVAVRAQRNVGTDPGCATVTLLAKATAPSTIFDGDVIFQLAKPDAAIPAGTDFVQGDSSDARIVVPSGKRLDFMTQASDTGSAQRSLLYTAF